MISIVVPIIVIIIIILQIYFFSRNIKRMNEYSDIFDKPDSWGIVFNPATKFVLGISGKGNNVFTLIKTSINKYLGNNSGSVIDFQLLKDAVDRHCDSVENDVNTLTPIPLYCGLAGTMAGVIVGLSSLLSTGSITALLSSGSSDFGAAATGVNDLLSGVAWAMLASICGIIFTTLSSILFKARKIKGEAGKNSFLAWLQAKLLSELPSDTSDALNRLVKNLNSFNRTFADNTTQLRGALRDVNESYRIQGDIIKAVHDMDVMKMAKANVRVLEELKECTDKLEQFNQYLNDIHGYTDAIHTFTTQFERESYRLHVLEEIKAFFERHKGEIAKDTADCDSALQDALATLRNSASTNTIELNKTLTEQAEAFKQIIREERDSFVALSNDLNTKFETELGQIPMLQKRLSDISGIPAKLDILINKMENSNAKLATSVAVTMDKAAQKMMKVSASKVQSGSSGIPANGSGFSKWMRWTILLSAIIVALACLSNTVYNIWFSRGVTEQKAEVVPVDTIANVDSNVSHKDTSTIKMDSVSGRMKHVSSSTSVKPKQIKGNKKQGNDNG